MIRGPSLPPGLRPVGPEATTELPRLIQYGGLCRVRTGRLRDANAALYQMS